MNTSVHVKDALYFPHFTWTRVSWTGLCWTISKFLSLTVLICENASSHIGLWLELS